MKKRIIYCRCIYSEILSKQSRELFQTVLDSSQYNITTVDDLCSLAAKKDSKLINLLEEENLTLIACHPRAVKWLLSSAGVGIDQLKTIRYFNLMKQPMLEILEKIDVKVPQEYRDKIEGIEPPLKDQKTDNRDDLSTLEKNYALQHNKESSRPWFPVIDYSKCTNCGACMDFCLFGVYEKREDGSIEVKTPFNCKDNCPACARICPHNAIIFPKYDKAPVNGDMDEYTNNTPHKTPIFALSGDELYKALSKRNKKNSKKLYK